MHLCYRQCTTIMTYFSVCFLGLTRTLNLSCCCGAPFTALLIMFFLEYFDMLSGGALGSLATGLVTCYMWESGYPAKLSLGPQEGYTTDIERVMAKVWNWVMEPMLFATIGTSIVFANLSSSTIPLAVLIVCTGGCSAAVLQLRSRANVLACWVCHTLVMTSTRYTTLMTTPHHST